MTDRRLAMALAALLLVNPAIVFLLTKSSWLALSASLTAVVAVQVASGLFHRLFAAYVFNAVALASIFLYAEAILVFGFPERVVENLYTIENGYYFNRPFLEETFTSKEFSVHYRTNVQGLRIGLAQDSTHRVAAADWLVLGDSFTQGAQVEFEELFTTKLNERFPDKTIVNAGISGFGIGHEYNYFADQGRLLQPRLVILQLSGFNDFYNVEPEMVGFTDRLMTSSAFVRYLLADYRFKNPAALPLGRWTEPFQPTHRDNADFNIFYRATSPTKTRDLDRFRHYLLALDAAVRSSGGRLLVALIPTKEQVYQRYYEEVAAAFHITPDTVNMLAPNEFLRDLTASLDIDFVDLLQPFRGASAQMFWDYDEHMTPAGHRVTADAIADHIARRTGASPVTVLSRDLAGDRYPVVSRDGRFITYQSFRDGNFELFLANRDMSDSARLTFDDVDQIHPMLSPDGSRLVFTEGSSSSHTTDVVVTNLDGSGRYSLTPDPDDFGAIPTWSPSGRYIAYAGWRRASGTDTMSLPRIRLFDVSSGKTTDMTPRTRDSWRPTWSPDERHVVYISRDPAGKFDLFRMDRSTGLEEQLTHSPFDEWDPTVSPDGSTVYYAAHKDGNWDLFALSLAEGSARQVTTTLGDEWDPSVSPDGRTLLYAGRFGVVEAIYEVSLLEP